MKRRTSAAITAAATVAMLTPAVANASTRTSWGIAAAPAAATWGASSGSKKAYYRTVYSDDFTSLQNTYAWQSPVSTNDAVLPTDNVNAALQKPTLASDDTIVKAGADNHALQVATKAGAYQTTAGPVTGITNGRIDIGPNFSLAGHVVSIRLRTVGAAASKDAVMVWPSSGWPWESDLAETLPYQPGLATANDHMELVPGQTAQKPVLLGTMFVNPATWHTYTVEYLGTTTITGIEYLIDGKPVPFVEDGKTVTILTGRWIPTSGVGHVAIGKALPFLRSSLPMNYFDAVQVDWVHILAH